MPFVDTSSLRVVERLPGLHARYFHSPSSVPHSFEGAHGWPGHHRRLSSPARFRLAASIHVLGFFGFQQAFKLREHDDVLFPARGPLGLNQALEIQGPNLPTERLRHTGA